MAEAENIAVVRRYFEEVYNQGNADVLPELVTDDYVDYGHADPGRGVQGAKDDLQGLQKIADQINYTIDTIIAAGDAVGCAWTGTMRHSGEAFGIQPTGKKLSYKGISIYKFRNGKIAETHNVQDFGSLFAQLKGEA